ncbi:GalNAc-alpha-(1-_4)-GalNAc-alpha-(1-_3)-diNAcBac-PP-undecaprenol alpha-1,4-N-acetyl-D-galactosaminyltransferase [subsurface metagenome]
MIDSLNSGGAQRQLCMLAILLKQRGFDTHVMFFRKSDFFRPLLNKGNVSVELVPGRSKIRRSVEVIRALRRNKPDAVIAFLEGPTLLTEFSGFLPHDYAIIVSERSASFHEKRVKRFARFTLHRIADAVVTNSYSQLYFLQREAGWLKDRIKLIPNCVDLDYFRPIRYPVSQDPGEVRILVMGRFAKEKNPISLVRAIAILKRMEKETRVVVDWYGNNFFLDGKPSKFSSVFLDTQAVVQELALEDHFRLHSPVQDAVRLYYRASVVCLPSLWEGLPNVLCEAMACGKPILASDVCDNAKLVKNGKNGFLFDPQSPDDIAHKVSDFCCLSEETKRQMGENNRKLAEETFSPSRFADDYAQFVLQVAHSRKRSSRA